MITDKALARIKQARIKQFTQWIKKHPNKSVFDLMKACRVPLRFVENHTICMKCGHIEEKALYAIVQTAQGHPVTFHCKCGNKFSV